MGIMAILYILAGAVAGLILVFGGMALIMRVAEARYAKKLVEEARYAEKLVEEDSEKDKNLENLEEIDRVAAVLEVLREELAKEVAFNTRSASGNVNAIVLFGQLWRHLFALSRLCQASVRMYNGDDPLFAIADAQRIVMTELAEIHAMLWNVSPSPDESKNIIAGLYDICCTLCKTHLPEFRRYWIGTSGEEKVKSGLAIAVNLTPVVEMKGNSNDAT